MMRFEKKRQLLLSVGFCMLILCSGLHGEEQGSVKELVAVTYKPPVELNDGLEIASLEGATCDIDALTGLVAELRAGQHDNLYSILIAKDNKLVFEYYMNEGKIDEPHMLMSITKNMVSFAVMKAIELGVIKSVDDYVVDYYPDLDKTKLAEGADKIQLKHCLSMQSGILVEGERKKESNAFCQKRVPSRAKTELSVPGYLYFSNPIVPESRYKYQSSDPTILGNILYKTSELNVVDFMDKYFFKPMQIRPEDYVWAIPETGLPGTGAGCYLTPRTMLKLGIMVAQEGVFGGKRVLSKESVSELLKIRVPNRANYGYFWRTHDYQVNGEAITCHSCRGAGGQFILLMPSMNLIVVTTGKVKHQTTGMDLTGKVILPAFL